MATATVGFTNMKRALWDASFLFVRHDQPFLTKTTLIYTDIDLKDLFEALVPQTLLSKQPINAGQVMILGYLTLRKA